MKKDLITFIGNKIFGRIPEDKKDRVILILILVFAILAVVDFFVPDPLPIVDEVLLPVITILLGQWYARRKTDRKQRQISSEDENKKPNQPSP